MIIAGVLSLVLLVPNLAVSVRRCHDIGWSGWRLLLGFIPLVQLMLLRLYFEDSQRGTNQYGPSEKYPS